MLYLISGTLYVVICLLIYAMIRTTDNTKIEIGDDFSILILAYILLFIEIGTIFFYPLSYLCVGALVGFIISLIFYMDDLSSDISGKNPGKWWQYILVFIGCTLFFLIAIPFAMCIIHFELDKKWDKK